MTAAPAVRLGDVATIERDMIAPEDIRSGTQYVGLEHVESSGRFVGVREVEAGDLASTKFAFNPSHVLYGKLRPYLCKIARPGFSGVCTTEIVPIKSGAKLSRDYLYHFLRLPRMVEFATSRCSGANLPRLSPKMLADFEIPLPPLAEQKRIAAVLDKADDLRAKRRHALATLDTLLQSVFLDMFGDPVTNPKGWPMVTIGDLADTTYGSSAKADKSLGAYPMLRMNNLTMEGRLDTSDLKYVNLNGAEVERYTVRRGELLFNRTNSEELVGKTALYDRDEVMAYAGYLIRLRVGPESTPEFVWAFLNCPYAKRVLRGMCKQIIGMANINATELRSIRIPKPPLALQQEFSRLRESLRPTRLVQERAVDHLDALFASLQSAAFAGTLFDGTHAKPTARAAIAAV